MSVCAFIVVGGSAGALETMQDLTRSFPADFPPEQVYETEASLWAAMRALEEKAALAIRIADSMSDPKSRQRFLEQAEADRNHATAIKGMLFAEDKEANSEDRRRSA